MKSLAIWAAATAALALAASPAAAAYIYTPTSAYATVEGNTNNVVFDRNGDTHGQWFFDSSIFGTESLLIEGISFRFDIGFSNQNTNSGAFTFGSNFRIRLATLAGAASTTFENNLAGAVTVLSGPQTVPFVVGAPAGQTKPWGVQLTFATPYLYQPGSGKLVFDMFAPAQGVFGTFDFVNNSALESRLFNLNGNATTGGLDSFGPVARFDVSPAPEPAAWGLMILGFAGAGTALRRRRAFLARA